MCHGAPDASDALNVALDASSARGPRRSAACGLGVLRGHIRRAGSHLSGNVRQQPGARRGNEQG